MENISIADHLNQHCQCIMSNTLEMSEPFVNNDWSKVMAKYPVFVSQQHIDSMAAVVKIITELSKNPNYHRQIATFLPAVAVLPMAATGVLFGYDFHLTEQGPKLIEVNTNAGAAYINHHLNQSQSPCCEAVTPFMHNPYTDYLDNDDRFTHQVLEMFLKEFSLQQPGKALRTIAIVDDDPKQQFLYPEFLLFKALFEEAGIRTLIADPEDVEYDGDALLVDGEKIDLIYNRHTDFYLNGHNLQPIKEAYMRNQVVLTPNPRAYGLMADKHLLSLWSNTEFLKACNLDKDSAELLLNTIPQTERLTRTNADRLWKQRKTLFFKPINGYGSKASYNGAKLTRKVWAHIIESDGYIAQQYIAPSRRTLVHEGESMEFKTDLRNYVYDGNILMLSARLYRGQVTNMRTLGGGFATVYSIE